MPPPIQLQRLPSKKKPALKRALLFLALLILAAWLLAGCDARAADPGPTTITPAELKRAAASAWMCPGMHADWIDDTTVRCLKERP